MISVCIPSFENPNYFERALKSVINQKDCEFEIVVTDDSSTNVIAKVVEKYLAIHPIRYFKNDVRLGAVNNWNKAMSMARGDIKKLLHHDDWFVDDHALLEMVRPILENKADLVFSDCWNSKENGELLHVHKIDDLKKNEFRCFPQNLIFGNKIGAPSVMAISKDINVQFNPNYLWLSDVDFYIRAIRSSKKGASFIGKPLVCITSDGVSQISRECEERRDRSVWEYVQLLDQESSSLLMNREKRQYITSVIGVLNFGQLLRLSTKSIYSGNFFVLRYTAHHLLRKILLR